MASESQPLLALSGVRFGYPARPDFLGPIDVSVRCGECWGIVGPNGAGKSTLLRLMAGFQAAQSGRITLDGEAMSGMSHRSRAKRIAFLPQQPPGDLDLSVRDVVLMGRYPHRSMGLFDSEEDHQIAEHAMSVTATADFADRSIDTLSGGEAQRVHLAAALAQEPDLLLLDEPTASLDLQHQLSVLDILRRRSAEDGLAVVIVTHDVNLAFQFCTHALVIDDGHVVASGSPADALTPDVLGSVYGVTMALAEVAGAPDRRWIVAWNDGSGAQG